MVIDVRVDGGAPQQMVLFGGAREFRYSGFVGGLGFGRHCVTVGVRPDLSHTQQAPVVRVFAASLGVVQPGDAGYLSVAHAPVLYGRSVSALDDTPLLSYADDVVSPDGSHQLSSTVIWSNEDVGDGSVPAYEWGLFGRVTDIETILQQTVAPDGRLTGATYLSCGCEQVPDYPDEGSELPPNGETQQPFAGQRWGSHPVLRDATGNNDESDSGTTAFRLQPAPVTPPAAGQLREAAMDAHPWTYQISDQEIRREQVGRYSRDPRVLLAGDYRQYLIADLDTSPTGTTSVAVEVQVAGDPTWYSNDYEQMTGGVPSDFPLYTGGHHRTVVKLPVDWHGRGIAALRLRLNAKPGAPRSIEVRSLRLLEVTPDFQVVQRTPQQTLPPRDTLVG